MTRPGGNGIRVLVTRPAEDSAALVAELRDRGVETFVCPMLTIVLEHGPAPQLAGVQGLLFTSANGVRAFARVSPRRDLPAFAVGDRTAAVAAGAGFLKVHSAGGDVDSLAALVRDTCNPASGALLHAAGSEVAGDLVGQLGAAGFAVRRAVLYRARPATALTGAAHTAIADRELDLVLFYSPRSAATFVTLARRAGLETACESLEILCLSKAVAEAADPIMWRRVLVAARPTQDALLKTLDERLNRQ